MGATTVKALADTKAPTATSVTKNYTEGKDSFTVYANGVADDAGTVSKVEFAVWTKSDQSDIKWITGKNLGGGKWSATDNAANHSNLDGKYNIHVYATDNQGNRGFAGAVTIDVAVNRSGLSASRVAPNASSVESAFTVTAYSVTGTFSTSKVEFAVWSQSDQSDIKWYQGTKSSSNWTASVNYSNHNYNTGTYNIHVYGTDSLGVRKFLGSATVEVTGSNALPTMDRIEMTPTTITDSFTATLYNVQAGTGIAKVSCAVWSDTGGQDDIKWYDAISYNNGNWYINDNYTNHGKSTGTYNIHVYATDNAGNTTFVGSKTFTVNGTGTYDIMGASSATANQLVNYYISKVGLSTYPQYYTDRGMNLNKFAEMYVLEASYEGVKVEVAWAQMCLETNYLRFTGDVSVGQFNFAGLGATGDGEPGFNFAAKYGDDFWGIIGGIRGQIQHLKCYASTAALVNLNAYSEPYDPRFFSYLRGTATTVEALSQKWASSSTYGAELLAHIQGIKAASTAGVAMSMQSPVVELPDLEPSESISPEPSESVSPEPSESISPEPSESVSPEPSESVSPEPSESVSPEPSESVSPEPSESVSPEPSESVSPEPSESISPEPSESISPEPTTEAPA
jgi:hypothetical protein